MLPNPKTVADPTTWFALCGNTATLEDDLRDLHRATRNIPAGTEQIDALERVTSRPRPLPEGETCEQRRAREYGIDEAVTVVDLRPDTVQAESARRYCG